MKERFKELGYWVEGKLKDLCGEVTPDKRIVMILVMLLILVIGNMYITFSIIYNWGEESRTKQQPQIEHIRQWVPEQDKNRIKDFIDSPIQEELPDSQKDKMRQDSIDKGHRPFYE